MSGADNFSNLQKALNESLQNPEVNNRLLQYVQILNQINQREKLIKFGPNDQGNSNSASKAQ